MANETDVLGNRVAVVAVGQATRRDARRGDDPASLRQEASALAESVQAGQRRLGELEISVSDIKRAMRGGVEGVPPDRYRYLSEQKDLARAQIAKLSSEIRVQKERQRQLLIDLRTVSPLDVHVDIELALAGFSRAVNEMRGELREVRRVLTLLLESKS